MLWYVDEVWPTTLFGCKKVTKRVDYKLKITIEVYIKNKKVNCKKESNKGELQMGELQIESCKSTFAGTGIYVIQFITADLNICI